MPASFPPGSSGGGGAGVASFNTRTGAVTLGTSDVTGVLGSGLPLAQGGTAATTAAGARTALGLGSAATQASAAFLQPANNLSEVTAATARTNLGLGTAATQASSAFLIPGNNLSEVTPATARTNLGLSTVAASGVYADLTSKPTLSTNRDDYVVSVTQPGVTGNNQVLLMHPLPHAITLPASLTGSSATAGTAATGSTVFTFAYVRSGSATSIATITFSGASTTGTFSGISIPTLAAGDVLKLTGPGTADATLADIGFSFLGTKQ